MEPVTTTLEPEYERMPQDLREYDQWVVWRAEQRAGRMTKVPYRVNGQKADVTQPGHWSSFSAARQCATDHENMFHGIGFVLATTDPFVAIDLDHCLDEHGTIEGWALAIVNEIDSYAEWSPSGEGVRIVARGHLESGGNKRGSIEVYDHDRYVTITGVGLWDEGSIEDRQDELTEFHRRHFGDRPSNVVPMPRSDLPVVTDEEAAELANADPQWQPLCDGDDNAFNNDPSAGDHVFCKILARVTGDDDQIDRIYRRSARMRDKWDSRRGNSTYGANTITAARLSVLQELVPSADPFVGPDGFGFHDVGNAQRLLHAHAGRIRWIEQWNKWMVYDRGRWVEDPHQSRMQRMASELADPMLEHIGPLRQDSKAMKQLMQWYRQTKTTAGMRSTVSVAMTRDETRTQHTELDAHPWLFNAANCTIDLHTGYVHNPDPAELLTKRAAVRHDPDAKAPRWEAFLAQILPERSVRNYVQQLASLTLIGDPQELLPILYGTGANGKTTLTEVIAGVLGEYAVVASQDLLIMQQHQAHPTSKAALFGVRFAHSGEIDQGDRLNESLVKSLTGGDTITARRMHEDFWEFQPSHLLWLHANYRPRITGTDTGIWRRVKLIPFEVQIPKEQRIEGYARQLLRSEGPGILNWLLDGLGQYRRQDYRLAEPPAVIEATSDYRRQTDTVTQFIEAAGLVFDEHLWIKAGQLDMAHAVWYASASVRHPIEAHAKLVKAELRRRGCEPVGRKIEGRNTQTWIRVGIPDDRLDLGQADT